MRKPYLRYGIMVALLFLAALFSLAYLFTGEDLEASVDLTHLIPYNVGSWQGTDLDLQQDTLRLLGTENVLFRTYEKGGAIPVKLCITFSASRHRVTHPAEVCYEGQGWEIGSKERLAFTFTGGKGAVKQVNRMTVRREDHALEVVFWYCTSSYDTASFLRQKLGMLISRLFGGGRWSAMVRLSAPVLPGREARARDAIADLGGLLLPHLESMARELDRDDG